MSRLCRFITGKIHAATELLSAVHSAVLFCLLYCLSGCLLAHGTFLLRLITAVSGAVLFLLGVLLSQRCKPLAILRPAAIGVCIGAAASLILFNGYVAHMESYSGQTISVKGYIRETVYVTNYSGCYIVQITDGMPGCRVVLDTLDPDLDAGQEIAGEITLRTLQEGENGSFDERSYYLNKSVVLAAEDIGCVLTGENRFNLSVFFGKVNAKLSSLFNAHIQGDGLASAVLLGNRDHLSDSAQRDFRRLGILHLLAVSGTHLSVIMVFSGRLFIYMRIRPGKRLVIQAVLCVIYMALTGFSASVNRAGLMHLVLLLCQFLQLKMKYFNVLVLSCTGIILVSPFAVLDASLHLSFLATCGCLISIHLQSHWEPMRRFCTGKKQRLRDLSPLQRFIRKVRREVCSIFVMTVLISLLMMPLSWLYFGEVSLVGFIVGILYIPLISLLMYLSIFYLITYPIGILILPLGKIISVYSAFLLRSASLISHLPHITLSLKYPFMPLFLIPLFLCVLFVPLVRRKGKLFLCSGILFCAMLMTVGLFHLFTCRDVAVIYRNVDKNDGFVLQNGTDVVLADVSDGSYTFTQYLLHEAQSVYATELDGYLLTHYHKRHIATLEKLSDNWILRKLYLTPPQNDAEQEVYDSLTACAERKGIRVILLGDDTVLFDDLSLICPDRTYLSRSSHPITALFLERNDTRFTYVSSSWNESDGNLSDVLVASQGIVFGSHSPVYKKKSDLTLVKPEWIVWNGESDDWVKVHTDTAVPQFYGCSRLVYRFS
ncbi:MAG: ComEC/Rec2 family competence protein [Clostridia bacterium]|nr:ComEC/Rec2 family competence protein [Clostridia bacterium]